MEFVDVNGFEDILAVSRCGKVLGKRSGKILKTFIAKSGYEIFSTRVGGKFGKTYCFKVHRLVAKAFVNNPENKEQVNHKNGLKSDNRFENLEWCSNKENCEHAWRTGLSDSVKVSGTRNKFSKIDTDKLAKIKSLKGLKTCREVGTMFDMHHTNISKIWRGVTYKSG